MSNCVQAQIINHKPGIRLTCLRALLIFFFFTASAHFYSVQAQTAEMEAFNNALLERMALQKKIDSVQSLIEQIEQESTLLKGKVSEWNFQRDSLVRQAKFLAKRPTFESQLYIAKKELIDAKSKLSIALADPEIRRINDSLNFLRNQRASITKTSDSLRKISVTKTRDYRKDSIYTSYVNELRQKVALISDERIKDKFEKNIQPTLRQMREAAYTLLQPSYFYDTLKVNQVISVANNINNNLQLNSQVSKLYQEILQIHATIKILNRSNQLLYQPFRKKEIQESISLLQPLQGLEGYDLSAINNEIVAVQRYLQNYCSVTAAFWRSYNQAVNPIPAVTAEMLGELESRLDKRYVYLASIVNTSKKNAQAGKKITANNSILDTCQ